MYEFRIVIKKYIPKWRILNFSHITVSNITLIDKKDSVGSLWKSNKYIKSIKGRFEYKYGSHRYPDLVPKDTEVIIYVHNFPRYPKLGDYLYGDVVTIEDVKHTIKN